MDGLLATYGWVTGGLWVPYRQGIGTLHVGYGHFMGRLWQLIGSLRVIYGWVTDTL